MKLQLRKGFLSYFKYAGFTIGLYFKKETLKAVEFCLLDKNYKPTQETIWIPKVFLRNNKYDSEYYGLEPIFAEYKNKEKLRKVGYNIW